MATEQLPEIWLRGPINGIPALLQPAAHALLQASEEIQAMMKDFPDVLLWKRPAQLASAGFHLQHITGVLDRMYSYAHEQPLTEAQFTYLRSEGKEDVTVTTAMLVTTLVERIHSFVAALHQVPEQSLTQFRAVGRKQLPSTVCGLLFHAAEHTMRHNGQLLVTVRVLQQL
ncbi:Protein of unknown function [Filimonas lacunae]|uniref:DinB-like domain-containing protein n=1 Tax=Filimonas lacunae TaxID=477680 RepID=A0A173MES7_9BACT|nr:DinB family protein [Filimonas lacunae]BAV06094.1 hypothetical protein FLA_2109 [Filimonas lacunae]SIT24623.1 Protein of unknown function [Filimonas lacunae]